MKKAPEQFRDRRTPGLASDSSFGNNGMFVIPHYRISNYEIRCLISDGMGWEHVSVTIAPKKEKASRCPTWEEMCWIKDQFFDRSEVVVQFHPAESEYVNNHKYCLHMWKKVGTNIETPPSLFVGYKDLKPENFEK